MNSLNSAAQLLTFYCLARQSNFNCRLLRIWYSLLIKSLSEFRFDLDDTGLNRTEATRHLSFALFKALTHSEWMNIDPRSIIVIVHLPQMRKKTKCRAKLWQKRLYSCSIVVLSMRARNRLNNCLIALFFGSRACTAANAHYLKASFSFEVFLLTDRDNRRRTWKECWLCQMWEASFF